jgi:hypothetical protein
MARAKEIVVTTPAAPRDRKTALQTQMVSAKILYIDDGWADDGLSVDGYVRNERFQYQRSDLWFCLLRSTCWYPARPRIASLVIMKSTKRTTMAIQAAAYW